ncbi:MAG: bifunctional adenosylcobinamide kinase/adenosylcobinamide-phosphate guanylyltransferase, partial [bacterium]
MITFIFGGIRSGKSKFALGLAEAIKGANFDCIIVSNDVGSSIVPENELARRFVDLMGFGNQVFASISDNVFLMTAGIPTKIKILNP